MEITTTWTAIRTDRELTRAYGGALLATRPVATCATPATPAVKPINGSSPMSSFARVEVPAYVADQESHPPRERSVG